MPGQARVVRLVLAIIVDLWDDRQSLARLPRWPRWTLAVLMRDQHLAQLAYSQIDRRAGG